MQRMSRMRTKLDGGANAEGGPSAKSLHREDGAETGQKSKQYLEKSRTSLSTIVTHKKESQTRMAPEGGVKMNVINKSNGPKSV